MSLTSAAPQPNLAWDFQSSNVDYVLGISPTTSVGPPTYNSEGKYGASIVFNNTPGAAPGTYYLNYTTGISLSTASGFTVCVWIKPLALGANSTGSQRYLTISSSQTFFFFGTNLSSSAVFFYGQNPFSVPNVIQGALQTATERQWIHVSVVFSGTSITTYYNAVNKDNLSLVVNPVTFTALSLGNRAAISVDQSANCEIDDLRIFNTALSASQVNSIYAAQGMPGKATGLVTGRGSAGTPADLAPTPATVPAVATTASGPISTEGAIVLSGTGIQVNAAKFPFDWWTSGGFTIEAWVKYTSFTNALASGVVPLSVGLMQIAGNIADWAIGPNASGAIQFYYYSGGQNTKVTSNVMTTGTWTHICAQHDGTNFHMYINGVRSHGPTAISGLITVSTTHTYLSFGQYLNSAVPNYSIGDVRLVRGANVYPVTGFTAPSSKLTTSPVGTTVFLLQVPLIDGTSNLVGQTISSRISTAPLSAFSLRAINGTAVRAVRVLRKSDNAQQDFWADRLGNLLTAPITGQPLQNWLGGSASNILTWYDQSGNGRDATGTQATIVRTSNVNQQWAINPANGGLSLSGGAFLNGTDFTITCTTKRLGTQGNDGVYGYGANASWVAPASVAATYGDNTRFGLVMPNAGSTSVTFNDSSYSAAFSSNANVVPSTFVAATEPTVYTAVTLTGATQRMYVNGTANGAPISSLTQVTANASAGFTIGTIGYYGNFLGEMGELLIFNTALSASDISTLYSAR